MQSNKFLFKMVLARELSFCSFVFGCNDLTGNPSSIRLCIILITFFFSKRVGHCFRLVFGCSDPTYYQLFWARGLNILVLSLCVSSILTTPVTWLSFYLSFLVLNVYLFIYVFVYLNVCIFLFFFYFFCFCFCFLLMFFFFCYFGNLKLLIKSGILHPCPLLSSRLYSVLYHF